MKYTHPNWVLRSYRKVIKEPVLLRSLTKNQARRFTNTQNTPNDPVFQKGLHWHYLSPPRGMNAVNAWKMVKGHKRVIVAVLDTGQLFDHPDIVNSRNILRGYDFISDPDKAADGDGERCKCYR